VGLAPLPPQSVEFERAILGAILIEGIEGYRRVPLLTSPEQFWVGANRTLFAAMQRLAHRGSAIDILLVSEELRSMGELDRIGGHVYLTDLLREAAILHNLPEYEQIVVDSARRRALLELSKRLEYEAQDGKRTEAIVLMAETTLAEMRMRPTTSKIAEVPTEWTALQAHRFPPRTDYIGHGILPKCSLMVVGGMTFLGKSALCYNLLAQRARGRAWLGHPTDPGVTLSLSAEIKLAGIQERLTLMLGDEPDSIPKDALHFRDERGVKLDTPGGYDRIAGWVQETGATILHVDPIAKYMSTDENSGLAMGRVVDALESLADRFQLGVIAVHHEGHANRESGRTGFDRLRGHTALASAADTVLMLSRDGDGYRLEWQLRHARTPEPMRLTRDANLWYHPAGLSAEDQAVAKIVAVIGLTYDGLVGAIKEDAKVSESTAKRRLKAALASGAVEKVEGRYVAGPKYEGSRVHEGSHGG
jgi:replicative DNA helicase